MTRFTAALVFLSLATAVWADPHAAVAAALTDARQLPAAQRVRCRYLFDPYDSAERVKAFAFHVNQLSRDADMTKPAPVGKGVYRVELADYGWPTSAWEQLAESDPYFHVLVEIEQAGGEKLTDWPGGVWTVEAGGDGKFYPPGRYAQKQRGKKVRQASAAVWLDGAAVAELAQLTGSTVPIVRADWFVVQTSAQVDREPGYYDFLGLKNRADYEKLIALDVEASKRIRKEIAAIVNHSGVAINNRQIYRYQSLTGGAWVTLDAFASKDTKNAVRLLNGDYKHDAEEHYGFLPNGLFAFFLSNAAGERQDSVPDGIAGDHKATGNDRRIHPGISCVRCHVEGLRPIDDWARKGYREPTPLQSVDYERLKRLRRLYLSDLERHLVRDREDYASALERLNGLTPKANAEAYAEVWESYVEKPRTLERIARELGTTAEKFREALKRQSAKTGYLDPVLSGMLQNPELTIRYDHWEEIYGTVALMLREGKP